MVRQKKNKNDTWQFLARGSKLIWLLGQDIACSKLETSTTKIIFHGEKQIQLRRNAKKKKKNPNSKRQNGNYHFGEVHLLVLIIIIIITTLKLAIIFCKFCCHSLAQKKL